ncbi:MAG: site-specific DNA-methyltransferase [Phycisphaerales bacterium]|nr:MAG: site-specific DNA-methyltransferase [Phycisphaerales bacterium]
MPVIPNAQYAYNPHLPPVLRFDATGRADEVATRLSAEAQARAGELLIEAQRRALTRAEAEELSRLLESAACARVAAEPWLEWTGKRERRAFEVDPVALHIHERVSAQAILKVAARQDVQRSLFADPEQEYHEAVQFYRHDVNWANRLILGDSLMVCSSLARREDLAGKVQMIYIDPPYGIKFASNFQPEVGRRDVKDKEQDLTREAEMVRAYRDTWHLGLHSYLSYLRDRLIVARELLADTGSIFVQISDENVHRVRNMLDEVFGNANFIATLTIRKTTGSTADFIPGSCDYLLWYGRDRERTRFHPIFAEKRPGDEGATGYKFAELPSGERVLFDPERASLPDGAFVFAGDNITSQSMGREKGEGAASWFEVSVDGRSFNPGAKARWKTNESGMRRLLSAERLIGGSDRSTMSYKRRLDDFPVTPLANIWSDTVGQNQLGGEKVYVVQTALKVIERCMLMTTDPGDLVLDPTCGSGTTAYVAEQWGRRWITIDTSRVAIAIARQRLLTAKYDMYRVRTDEQSRDREGAGSLSDARTAKNPLAYARGSDIGTDPHPGFIYKTVPHITLKSIAQNVALDPIFAKHEPILDEALAACNAAVAKVGDATRAKLCAKLAAKAADEGLRAISHADARRWLLPGTSAKAVREAMETAFAKVKRNLTPNQKRAFEGRIPTPAEVGPSSVPAGGVGWEHWEAPFDIDDDDWPSALCAAVTIYRKAWRAKMDEVNACIAASAEQEELVDQPEIIRGVTRVTGPFTVEAVQPPEMSLGDNIDPYTARDEGTEAQRHEGEAGGLFDGAPESLSDEFEPRSLRMVEPKNDLEVANVTAYLEQMFRYLKADGVRFLGNKQMKWTRLEPLFEVGRAGVFHAEGRWQPVENGGKGSKLDPTRDGAPNPNPERERAGLATATADQEPLADARGSDDDGPNNVAVVFGPQFGPVTAKLVEEAIRQANRSGYDDLVIAGFSFDGASTGVLSEGVEPGVFEGRGGHRLRVHFAHVRPDVNPGMNGLLKESPQPGAGQLFSVFGLPRVRIEKCGTGFQPVNHRQDAGVTPRHRLETGATGEYVVEMEGVDIYNPVDNSITSSGASKVAAWFLDSDYDGRTFCITQAFFPDRAAWDKLARALNGKDGPIDADRFEAFSGTTSLPFPAGKHRCVAVKVIDPRGNEVMTVERLT